MKSNRKNEDNLMGSFYLYKKRKNIELASL